MTLLTVDSQILPRPTLAASTEPAMSAHREETLFAWLKTPRQVREAVERRRLQSVLLVTDPAMVELVARDTLRLGPLACARGTLVLTVSPRASLLAALQAIFRSVVCLAAAATLEPRDLVNAMASSEACGRLIGAMLDGPSGVLALWRGDARSLAVPIVWFSTQIDLDRAANAVVAIRSGGQELAIGEAVFCSDDVIAAFDPDHRRRLRWRRWQQDTTLGAMVRRRRHELGLRREEFPGIDAKTVARIERGEILRPQRETLRLIAQCLGLDLDSLQRCHAAT
ncbi:MAG: helix-turn-helix transcriptional regulator [Phycisphaerales bacterium]|nr:helix-turn-helix transcriptional regulator [Phycisphaerales bacterium]